MKNSTKLAIGLSILGIGAVVYFIIKGKKPVILGQVQQQPQQKPEFQIRPPQQQTTTQPAPAKTTTQPTRPPLPTTKPSTPTTTKPTTKPTRYGNYDDYYGGFGGYGDKTAYMSYYSYGILDTEYRDGARTYPTLKTM